MRHFVLKQEAFYCLKIPLLLMLLLLFTLENPLISSSKPPAHCFSLILCSDFGKRRDSFWSREQHLLGASKRSLQLQLSRREGLQQTNHSGELKSPLWHFFFWSPKLILNSSIACLSGEPDGERLADDFCFCRRPRRDQRSCDQRGVGDHGEGGQGVPQTGERKPHGGLEVFHFLRIPGFSFVRTVENLKRNWMQNWMLKGKKKKKNLRWNFLIK